MLDQDKLTLQTPLKTPTQKNTAEMEECFSIFNSITLMVLNFVRRLPGENDPLKFQVMCTRNEYLYV